MLNVTFFGGKNRSLASSASSNKASCDAKEKENNEGMKFDKERKERQRKKPKRRGGGGIFRHTPFHDTSHAHKYGNKADIITM